MQRLVTLLLVAASLVFAFIILQNHFALSERVERLRSEFTPADLRNKDYQLKFDVAGKKGTISLRTQPSDPQDQKAVKKPQKASASRHAQSNGQPQAAPPSGTKSQ